MNAAVIPDLNSPVVEHARKDFPLLNADTTVGQALERIRREGLGERVIYFFAIDADRHLVGVLPTRRLLTAQPETSLREIMVRKVVAIPATATVLEACEFFVLYKFLAFPVVDQERHLIGVIDVTLFAEELLQADGLETSEHSVLPARDNFFEMLGFHLAQVRDASPWRVFRYRLPWLLVTVGGGTISAFLAHLFEATLAHSLVIAFFLTMVLGLNESVSTQSMTVTIQALRSARLDWGWFVTAFRRELITAVLLGLACGAFVAVIVIAWRGDARAANVIGGSIALSLVTACLFGLGVPSLLHHFKLDPKIAAGPITLALADFFALVFYFTSAWLVLT